MEKVFNIFDLDETKFNEYNKKSTEFVKSYYDDTMKKEFKEFYCYLDDLDNDLSEYYSFGADKSSICDFQEFCKSILHSSHSKGN